MNGMFAGSWTAMVIRATRPCHSQAQERTLQIQKGKDLIAQRAELGEVDLHGVRCHLGVSIAHA